MLIKINDASTSHRYKDNNGFLIIRDNPIAKAGVFDYLLSEVDSQIPTQNDRLVKVCRSFDNLLENKDKFSNMPLKFGHKWVGENDDKQVDGAILSEVRASEPYLIADLIIYNSDVIKKIENGEVIELSPGYEARFVSEQGTYNGESYDFKQLLNSVNHLAVVKEGRSGSDLRILDNNKKELKTMKFKEKLMNAFKRVLDENVAEKEEEVEVKDNSMEVASKLLEIANSSEMENESKLNAIVEMLNDLNKVDDSEEVIEKEEEIKDEEVIEKEEVVEKGGNLDITAEELAEIIEKVTDSKIKQMKNDFKKDSKAVFDAYSEVRNVLGCDFSYQDKSVNDIYKFGYEALSKRKIEDGMDALTAFKLEARMVNNSNTTPRVKVKDSKDEIYSQLLESIKQNMKGA